MGFHILIRGSSPGQTPVPLRQLSPELSHSTQPLQPNLTRHPCNPLTLAGYGGLTHRGARRPSSPLITAPRGPYREVRQHARHTDAGMRV